VFIKFKAPPPVLAELNRFYLVSDDVVRQLTCKAVRTRGVVPAAVPAAATAAPATAEAPSVDPSPIPAAPAATPNA